MASLIFVTMAGHGGEDSGAPNPYHPWLPEKTLNLKIDEEFARLARLNSHTVYRLRTGDYKVSLNDIYPKVVQVGAHAAFEFHCDSVTDQSANGCHAVVLGGSPGEQVGMSLVNKIEARTGIRAIGTKTYFWGNSPTPIYTANVTRFVQMANMIHSMTENGFISNVEDEAVLSSASGQFDIAFSHLAAVHNYYGLGEPITSLPPDPPNPPTSPSGLLILGVAGLIGWGMYNLTKNTKKRTV